MINHLRYDFGYALVEEYKTYWEGFQDPNDAYCAVEVMDDTLVHHFKNRKQQAMAFKGVTEQMLIDQNTFWFVIYAKSLKALSCIDNISQDDIDIICKQNRWIHNRKIINLKDNNNSVDPLDP